MRRETRLTIAGLGAIAAIIGVACLISPWTRAPTGRDQDRRSETGAVQVLERETFECGETSERSYPALRLNLPRKVLDVADLVVVRANSVSMAIPLSRESCGSWTFLASREGPSSCLAGCREGSCVVSIHPRGIDAGANDVSLRVKGNGSTLAEASYRNAATAPYPPPATAEVRDGMLVVSRFDGRFSEEFAYARFLPGNGVERLSFVDGTARLAIPAGARSYEVVVRSRQGGVEAADYLSGGIGSCAS